MRLFPCLMGAVLAAFATVLAAQTPLLPQAVVVARGGVSVTLQDVDDYMQRVPVEKRAGMMDSPRRIEALLLNMLLNKQLAAQAEQMKLDHDPEVQGKTGLQRTEVLARLRLARFMKDLKVPDFEPLAHEEYLGHKDKYATPGPRTVQRIIVHTEKPGNKESEKQAWDKAEALRVEAVAAPDQFDQLVARSSDEADKASTHGIIKDVGHAKGDRWMKDALQSLHQPGDISGVVSAPGGYQVVKLLSAAPDVVPPFAAVHDQVVAQLKQNYIDSERQKFLDTLNSEKIEATPEIVASLRIRYDSPAMGAAPTSNP